jgi:hypothetical protein
MANYPTQWKVISNYVGGDDVIYQACRQKRALRPGEPEHSGVLDIRGVYHSREEAQAYVDQLNGGA